MLVSQIFVDDALCMEEKRRNNPRKRADGSSIRAFNTLQEEGGHTAVQSAVMQGEKTSPMQLAHGVYYAKP